MNKFFSRFFQVNKFVGIYVDKMFCVISINENLIDVHYVKIHERV